MTKNVNIGYLAYPITLVIGYISLRNKRVKNHLNTQKLTYTIPNIQMILGPFYITKQYWVKPDTQYHKYWVHAVAQLSNRDSSMFVGPKIRDYMNTQ